MTEQSTLGRIIRAYINVAPYILGLTLVVLAARELHPDGALYAVGFLLIAEFLHGVAGVVHAHWKNYADHPDHETERYEHRITAGTLIAVGIVFYTYGHPYLTSFGGTEAAHIVALGWMASFIVGSGIASILIAGLGEAVTQFTSDASDESEEESEGADGATDDA